MRGCMRTNEEERWNMVDYILFIKIHKLASTKTKKGMHILT